MKTYIALFKGINVGGRNVLPMKELKAILEGIGLENVNSYIQSGNVVFQSDEENLARLADSIGVEVEKSHGFKPEVMLLESEEVEQAMAANPFPEAEAEPKSLHLNFLASAPESADLEALESLKKENERFALIDKVFYLHAPDGIGRSKLARNSERLLGVPMTGRNWRTVSKIMSMAREAD